MFFFRVILNAQINSEICNVSFCERFQQNEADMGHTCE